MRLLVTGATGHVAREVVRQALAAGVEAYARWMRANPASWRAPPPANGLHRAQPVEGARAPW